MTMVADQDKDRDKDKRKKRKMGRSPCCDMARVKKGAWTSEEDKILVDYINKNGHGTWCSLPESAGLLRCGKSCRLRWTNYLRPGIKRGPFSAEEENTIIQLHSMIGNKWAAIASHLPERTDNEIKNFWNSHLKKRTLSCLSPQSQTLCFISKPNDNLMDSLSTRHVAAQWESARVEPEAQLSIHPAISNLFSVVKTGPDHFLRLWDSEVGDSFRKINEYGVLCQSPMSQIPSSTKDESGSGVTVQTDHPSMLSSADASDVQNVVDNGSLKKNAEDAIAGSDSSKLHGLDGSSDTTMMLLSGFHGGSELEFLQDPIDDVSIYLQDPI